jgi:hypothetical protein
VLQEFFEQEEEDDMPKFQNDDDLDGLLGKKEEAGGDENTSQKEGEPAIDLEEKAPEQPFDVKMEERFDVMKYAREVNSILKRKYPKDMHPIIKKMVYKRAE